MDSKSYFIHVESFSVLNESYMVFKIVEIIIENVLHLENHVHVHIINYSNFCKTCLVQSRVDT